ncbi:MAG TPA: glucosidase [Myxococcota bacterium]|nr:glucosidase [Myxococcota bacterium]
MTTAEQQRIATSAALGAGEWKQLGPYLSERAWGTVREDYSADGRAWEYSPHDQARSRAYRWSEDGLAGICDIEQRMCFALAFWNGRDPILKERIFGLTGNEGNHGEDAKEYWWYVDATPSATWLRWRYHYPQNAFPYSQLIDENRRRGRHEREFELADTGIFEGDRYWQIEADYAKASPYDLCLRLRVRNAGPEPAELHVLPTLWFRNRWSWDPAISRPSVRAGVTPGTALADEQKLGRWLLAAGPDPNGVAPELLFCDNDTNLGRVFGSDLHVPYPKDGIGDHVITGAPTVNPAREGTKLACWYRLKLAPGASAELRLRLARDEGRSGSGSLDLRKGFERTFTERAREADEFYASLAPKNGSADEARVMRQALSGLIWNQQFYHLNVTRWLDGDPGQPPPPESRKSGRNVEWRHLNSRDILAMPDKWEFPWFASWDLGFHCVILALLDPAAAKHQLLLQFREWYMHANGQLPAYEWNFGDVNPPVLAWAALTIFRIDGYRDWEFLESVFHKLLINFTWWVNRKDARGDNVFEGGFLGLDNVGPFDRSAMLPPGELLEQSDGTAWMAKFCLNMLEMALRLSNHNPAYQGVAVKFFEHFAAIADALDSLWDEEDGFFYDRLRRPDGSILPVRARSMVGLLPVFAAVGVDAALWEKLPDFTKHSGWFLRSHPRLSGLLHCYMHAGLPQVIAAVDTTRLRRLLARMLDENEFLSRFGLRSLSRYHKEHPLIVSVDGVEARLDYEPAESQSGVFGGNSNWRGPVWFPLNFLALESLRHLHSALGNDFKVELPTGSGKEAHLGEVADELERRLLRLFLVDEHGRRPCYGANPLFQRPEWRDQLLFHEYFHGDTGEGLGASHQTGWTALMGLVIARRGWTVPA